MSANRDKNQRSTFVYSNFYEIYKKAQTSDTEESVSSSVEVPAELNKMPGQTSGVIKPGDRREVQSYKPGLLIAKIENATRSSPDAAVPFVSSAQFQNQALDSLKGNLKSLNDLHSRLRFMLKELEDLVKEET